MSGTTSRKQLLHAFTDEDIHELSIYVLCYYRHAIQTLYSQDYIT